METPVHVLYSRDEDAKIHFVHGHLRNVELYFLLLELELHFVRLDVLVHASGFEEAIIGVLYFLVCQRLYDLLESKQLLCLSERGVQRRHGRGHAHHQLLRW